MTLRSRPADKDLHHRYLFASVPIKSFDAATSDPYGLRISTARSLVDSPNYRNEPKKHRGVFRSSFCLVPNTIHCRPRTTTGIGLCEAPDLDRRTAGPFAG
jgi:hypothetical protein